MFNGCSSLTSLDLSSFNTVNIMVYEGMFFQCSSLCTIYGGDWYHDGDIYLTSHYLMFYGCNNLIGGKGTKIGENLYYDENGQPHYYSCGVDGGSARIDEGRKNPGLFTAK